MALLEAEPQVRARPGSRAIYIHRESLELLERISPGLGQSVAGHGLVWPTKRTFWRGHEVYARHYPPAEADALPPFTSLPQVETERLLLEACRVAGVEIIWDARVADIETAPGGVTLVSVGPGGRASSWTADYVIAADGARSAVRHTLGIPMEGSRSRNTFVVVDVAEDRASPLECARVFHYEHPSVGGRNVLFVPFRGGWRIDLQYEEGDDPADFSGPAAVRGWLRAVLPAGYAERVTWVSTYQFMQVVARTFVDANHRVLLAGEAAHLFAPFGARGARGIGALLGASRRLARRRALWSNGRAEWRGREVLKWPGIEMTVAMMAKIRPDWDPGAQGLPMNCGGSLVNLLSLHDCNVEW